VDREREQADGRLRHRRDYQERRVNGSPSPETARGQGTERHGRRRRAARPELSLDQIVATAIGIADREGLDAVTMRAVARALGAGAMSLYWHVRDKNELLQLMFEETMRQASPPRTSSGDWRQDLASIATHARANVWAHPWILNLVGSDTEGMLTPESLVTRPGMMEHIENTFAKAAALPLDFSTRAIIAHMIDDFTLGFTAGEIQERRVVEQSGMSEDQRRELVAPDLMKLVATGNYPAFTEYIKHDEELPPMDERFKIALDILLDGVAVQIERTGRK
jgi:AcrR family transcriptional regulator